MDDLETKPGREPLRPAAAAMVVPGAPGDEIDFSHAPAPVLPRATENPENRADYVPPTPWQFQIRVLKALVLRNVVSRSGDTRLGYLLTVITPLLGITALLLAFELRGRTVPGDFSLPVFIITGYPLWQAFMGIYRGAAAAGSSHDPLLMFPQITQLDLILARIILDVATNTFVFILFATGIIIVLHAQLPADPFGVMMIYWSCSWIGAGFGMTMCAVQRIVPTVASFVTLLARFGMWISGVVFMVNSLPTWALEYLKWNPMLHCTEGARQLWSSNYQSSIFSPSYIIICGTVLTVVGFTLERLTRRWVGP